MPPAIQRTAEIRLTIPFHDLDPLGIVWHGNYLKYFDMARFALFDQAGVDLYAYYRQSNCLFPITRTSTKHVLPLRYRDEITVTARLVEAQIKIVLDFEIRRSGDRQICTRGRGEQVAVKAPEMEMLFEIPADVRKALEG